MEHSKIYVSPQGEKPKEEKPVLMAFPLFGVAPGALPGTATVIMQGGMELRDYFAAQYIAGAAVSFDKDSDEVIFRMIAEEAYLIAEEMLSAREKGGAK